MAVAIASNWLPVRQSFTTAGEAFLSWPYEVQLTAVFLVPFVMYWVKRRSPSVYGTIEVVLGGLFAFLALYVLLQEPTVLKWAALFTSIYWMSRGVQNLTEGIVAYKTKPKLNKNPAPGASTTSSAGSQKCTTERRALGSHAEGQSDEGDAPRQLFGRVERMVGLTGTRPENEKAGGPPFVWMVCHSEKAAKTQRSGEITPVKSGSLQLNA